MKRALKMKETGFVGMERSYSNSSRCLEITAWNWSSAGRKSKSFVFFSFRKTRRKGRRREKRGKRQRSLVETQRYRRKLVKRYRFFFFLTHVYRIPASTEDNRFILYSLFERLSSYLYSEQVLEITLNGCPTRRDSRKLKTGLLRHICCKAFRRDRTGGIVALSNV